MATDVNTTAPHTPTSAQITQLAVLQNTVNAANATLVAAQNSVQVAKAAKQTADQALIAYRQYINGGGKKNNVLDEGGHDVT